MRDCVYKSYCLAETVVSLRRLAWEVFAIEQGFRVLNFPVFRSVTAEMAKIVKDIDRQNCTNNSNQSG